MADEKPPFDPLLEQALRLPASRRGGGGDPSEHDRPASSEFEEEEEAPVDPNELGQAPVDPSEFTGE